MGSNGGMQRPVVLAVVVSLVTSVVVGAGTLALANHQWPDVATASPFHADIESFSDAGCATGFPDGTFRPTEEVNRQQAARFFRACGTRLQSEDDDDLTTVPSGLEGITLNSEPITAGAQGDGGGFVLGLATITLSTADDDSADFPCVLATSLTSPTAGHTGPDNLETSAASFRSASSATQATTVSMTEVWEVAAGETITVRTNVAKFGCDAAVSAESDLVLLYVPFDGQGAGGG
jgi:S-layer homology domain